MATTAPASVGTLSAGEAPGSRIAAVTPTAANAASPASPKASRRSASSPITAANPASRTRIPAIRASLSCVPKCVIANSLTGTGVRLIVVSPTATTGAPRAPVAAAVSSDTPSATAPASRPASAPAASRMTFMVAIRAHPGIRLVRVRDQSGAARASNRGHEQARSTSWMAAGSRAGAGSRHLADPGGARRSPRVRAGVRRTVRAGVRGGTAGAAGPGPVRGSRPGGPARALADCLPVRSGPGQRRRLGADDRAPPRGRPGPDRERLLAPRAEGRPGPDRRAGRGRRGDDLAGVPAGAPLPGRPDRAAARVDQAGLLQGVQLSGGRDAARGGARHGEDENQGRNDQDARLHGGDLVKNLRDDLHVLTGSYVLDAVSPDEREEFERHLQTCPACDAEVRGLRETAARLAIARAVAPPARMERQVLAATYQTRQLPPLSGDPLSVA